MITALNIKNFKSHSQTHLDLSCLNILSGLNGTGKSSIFQALLLLRQFSGTAVVAPVPYEKQTG